MWLLYWGVSLRQFGLERPTSPTSVFPFISVAHGVRGRHKSHWSHPFRSCPFRDAAVSVRSSSGWPVLHSPAVAPNMSMLFSIRKTCSFHSCRIVRPSTTFSPFFQLQVAERFQCLLSRPRMSCLKFNIFASISTMNCEYDEVTSSSVHLQDSPRVT